MDFLRSRLCWLALLGTWTSMPSCKWLSFPYAGHFVPTMAKQRFCLWNHTLLWELFYFADFVGNSCYYCVAKLWHKVSLFRMKIKLHVLSVSQVCNNICQLIHVHKRKTLLSHSAINIIHLHLPYVPVFLFNGLSYCFFSCLCCLTQFVMADISMKHLIL